MLDQTRPHGLASDTKLLGVEPFLTKIDETLI
jgi:hypothetical protein